jgi:hypothetical protein
MPTLTIDFSAEHGQRIQDALTESLNLDAPATMADFKAYVIQDVRQLVRNSEKRVAAAAATDLITDVDLT